MMTDYEERREQRREEERRYEADVYYDVWRAGGDPDRIREDRVQEHFYAGDFAETAARHELRAQRPKPSEEEQYYEQEQ